MANNWLCLFSPLKWQAGKNVLTQGLKIPHPCCRLLWANQSPETPPPPPPPPPSPPPSPPPLPAKQLLICLLCSSHSFFLLFPHPLIRLDSNKNIIPSIQEKTCEMWTNYPRTMERKITHHRCLQRKSTLNVQYTGKRLQYFRLGRCCFSKVVFPYKALAL